MQSEIQHEVPVTEPDHLPADGWDLESMVGSDPLRVEHGHNEQATIEQMQLAQRSSVKPSPGWAVAAIAALPLATAAPWLGRQQPPGWMTAVLWLTLVVYAAALDRDRIARRARPRSDDDGGTHDFSIGELGLYVRTALFEEWQDWSALGSAKVLPVGFVFDSPHGVSFLPSCWFTPEELEQLRQYIRQRLPMSGGGAESQPLPGGRDLIAPTAPAMPGAIRFQSAIDLTEYRVARPLCRRLVARRRPVELVALGLCSLMALFSPWPWPLAWLCVTLLPAVVLAEMLTSLRGCMPRYALGGGPAEWQVGDEGIVLAHPLYCSRRSWRCYPASAELPDHFILLWQGFVPHLVAKRCLTDEQVDKSRDLLRTHTHYRRHR